MSVRLLQLQRAVLSPDSEMPDELLYGRAGYLYALLYINKEIGADTVDESTITKVRDTHACFCFFKCSITVVMQIFTVQHVKLCSVEVSLFTSVRYLGGIT